MHTLTPRQLEIVEDLKHKHREKTDAMLQKALLLQWIVSIALAWFLSPLTWVGDQAQLHPHFYYAVLVGGVITFLPWYLAKSKEFAGNIYLTALCQMLFSSLFIHITSGRIESHFHVFGSLAILASYRDSKVLLVAATVTTIDHFVRGSFWPVYIYGTYFFSPWRAVEHTLWVVFEVYFLLYSQKISLQEMKSIAISQVNLEEAYAWMSRQEAERSQALEEATAKLLGQQQVVVNSARMSALGEMAGNIAHEINNPLALISASSMILKEELQGRGDMSSRMGDCLLRIDRTVERISGIVKGLKNVSRDATNEPVISCRIEAIVDDVIKICEQRIKSRGIKLEVVNELSKVEGAVKVPRVQVEQVLLNLLNNAHDAAEESVEKWIKVRLMKNNAGAVSIVVSNSGQEISDEIREKIFMPFFTTKEVGRGTGLGLSISLGLMQKMGGNLLLLKDPSISFSIVLPEVKHECA